MIQPRIPSDISVKIITHTQTPKKVKHKRKKVKMAILKYYKVESDGKIKRLRRECPTPTCGAGVFVGVYILGLSNSLFIPLISRCPSTKTASTVANAA